LSPTSGRNLNTLSPNNPLYQSFNKTITYLRASHTTPKISTFPEVVNEGGELSYRDPDADKLQHAFAQEINKFNKVKLQKQVSCFRGKFIENREKPEIFTWRK